MASPFGPQQASGRASKACIYCGRSAVTQEHVLPQWVKRVIGPTATSRSSVSDKHGKNGETVFRTVRFAQGSLFSKRPRIACRTCNGGWMAEMEGRTKPILLPLVTSTQPSDLLLADVTQLAAWAAKTAINFEYVDHPTIVSVEQGRRTEMMSTLLPPGGTSVWLGRTMGRVEVWAARSSWDMQTGPLDPDAPIDSGKRNAQIVGLGLGHVFILVLMSAVDLGAAARATHPGLTRIWPDPARSTWPGSPMGITIDDWDQLRALIEDRRAVR